jgi:hypothetical protein
VTRSKEVSQTRGDPTNGLERSMAQAQPNARSTRVVRAHLWGMGGGRRKLGTSDVILERCGREARGFGAVYTAKPLRLGPVQHPRARALTHTKHARGTPPPRLPRAGQ